MDEGTGRRKMQNYSSILVIEVLLNKFCIYREF